MESALFCGKAETAGVNSINVTGGWHETTVPQITTDVPPGTYAYLARAIKEKVGVPVFASNRLGDPRVAEKVLRSGAADMICWGRPLIADPELPNKVRTGRIAEIVPCIACNQGCIDSIFSNSAVCCTLNPRVGREGETEIEKTTARKRIYVVGGGPAGMEFALTAAKKGHEVTLFEKDTRLGGQINLIGSVPGKEEFLGAVRSLENRLEASGTKIRLGIVLTAEMVERDHPDFLIVASGARPGSIDLDGIRAQNVVSAWDVLDGTVSAIGKRVVIIGGGATGCETALFVACLGALTAETFTFLVYHGADNIERLRRLLYQSGRQITIIEVAERFAGNMGNSTRWALMKHLRLMGVELRPKTRIARIEEGGVVVETVTGTETIGADTVIVATGSKSVNGLAETIKGGAIEVMVIGDAREPRKILDAIKEGFDAALRT